MDTFRFLDESLSRRVHALHLPTPFHWLPLCGALLCSVYSFPFMLLANSTLLHFPFWYTPLLSAVLTLALSEVIKHIVQRRRPGKSAQLGREQRWPDLTRSGTKYSMPSGDTAQAAVTATLWWNARISSSSLGACWFLAFVLYVAFGRMYHRMHWAGDCVVGALLGASVTHTVIYVLQ
eukprot:GEMP01056545.1.p1 GENE.GEMP01056545.1~~GEMP01056545.1.p1  ORF type:complete len:178 (+),score=27.17 GEMP01056545.1:70-603(+)